MAIHSKTGPFKAMILAAGRGERMRPLTDMLPKPLLQAGKQSLIEHQLEKLARAGFVEIVVNHAYLGDKIETALGSGERYGVNIRYSPEAVVLETAGGIANALPLLNNESTDRPFLTVNADIYCDMDFASLLPIMQHMQLNPGNHLAHLVLVDNPVHHPNGDFALDFDRVVLTGFKKFTFSGIGIYKPGLFRDVVPGVPAKLAPLLRRAMEMGRVSGEYYNGLWIDVGTPERLSLLNKQLNDQHGNS